MNYNLIISFILLLIIVLKIYNKIDVTIHTIIIITIITVLLMLKMNSKENFTPQEVLQNLGSLYNDQNMTVTNLTVTGKLTVGDPVTNNVKMTVNDPSDNDGKNIKIDNRCNLVANTSSINTLNVTTTNVDTLNVSRVAQAVVPQPTGQPIVSEYLKYNDVIKLKATQSLKSSLNPSGTWATTNPRTMAGTAFSSSATNVIMVDENTPPTEGIVLGFSLSKFVQAP